MLILVSELKEIDKFKDIDEKELTRELKAVETAIRSYTHNNFQNRLIRFSAKSKDNKILGSDSFLKVNDTVEINNSVNSGLYTIKELGDDYLILDRDIFDFGYNLITKIEYPEDVVNGVIDILNWKYDKSAQKSRNGITSESETISRHSKSTSYKNYDGNNTINGYPSELFGFLKPYIKARV